jgi:hypothetical protein
VEHGGPEPGLRRATGSPGEKLARRVWLLPGHDRAATSAEIRRIRLFEDNDLSRLRYAQTIQVFSEAFGKEAVGVFVFEELAADPKGFIRKVCDFLGIDPQEGWNLCQGRRENDRWTAEQLLRLRKIEDSRWRREVFRRSPTRLRCWLLGLSRTGQPSRPGPKAEIDIPLDWRRRIEDLTREGNRWLAEEWDLPLAKYGYPV